MSDNEIEIELTPEHETWAQEIATLIEEYMSQHAGYCSSATDAAREYVILAVSDYEMHRWDEEEEEQAVAVDPPEEDAVGGRPAPVHAPSSRPSARR